jgi:hypothetical protein
MTVDLPQLIAIPESLSQVPQAEPLLPSEIPGQEPDLGKESGSKALSAERNILNVMPP